MAKNAAGKEWGGKRKEEREEWPTSPYFCLKGLSSSVDGGEGKGASAAVIGAPDQNGEGGRTALCPDIWCAHPTLNDAAVLGRNKVKFLADGWVSATNIERKKGTYLEFPSQIIFGGDGRRERKAPPSSFSTWMG